MYVTLAEEQGCLLDVTKDGMRFEGTEDGIDNTGWLLAT